MTQSTSAGSKLIARTILGSSGGHCLHQYRQAAQVQVMLSNQSQITAQALREPVVNTKWNGKLGRRRISHGSQRRIWQKKRDGEGVLEGNRWAAKGKEKNDTKGVRDSFSFLMVGRHREGMIVLRSGRFVSSRGFSKMIGEGCDVGGWLWSCQGAALRQSRIVVSSSEMSARSSITFNSKCTERLFAHKSFETVNQQEVHQKGGMMTGVTTFISEYITVSLLRVQHELSAKIWEMRDWIVKGGSSFWDVSVLGVYCSWYMLYSVLT